MDRFEICEEEGIAYRYVERDFADYDEAREWILREQVGQRNLGKDQKAAAQYLLTEPLLLASRPERARKGGIAGGRGRGSSSEAHGGHPATDVPEVKTRLWALAAREASVSQKAMRRVQKIAKQNRDLVFQILHGSSIKAAEQELREETYDAQAEQALREYPEGGNIHTGDMGLLNDLVPDATADMVMTDPVYGDVQLYGRVAELAQRKLKVGGLCACYVGHRNKRLIQREMKKYLDEHVEVLVLHSGACTRLYELEGLLQVQVHPALRETPEASESYTPLDS